MGRRENMEDFCFKIILRFEQTNFDLVIWNLEKVLSEKEEEYTSNYELDIQKVKFNSEIWLKLFVLTTAIGGLGSQDQCWSSTIMEVGLARK